MQDIFEGYQADEAALLTYGFVDEEEGYRYSRPIMKGDFLLEILFKDGNISYQVMDQETGDCYVQLHMDNMTGEFVGQVRKEVLEILLEIQKNCFKKRNFLYEQTQRLVSYVEKQYQGSLEYLWEDSSFKNANQSAVFRHQETQKWYGVLMTVDWAKLTQERAGKIEVLNVKNDQVGEHIRKTGIYPAFHMNKKYWLSLSLDGSLTDEELFELVDRSFLLTRKK